ncbi:bifunctional DNA primase/polymerase [Streptomyces sp. NPDC055085]
MTGSTTPALAAGGFDQIPIDIPRTLPEAALTYARAGIKVFRVRRNKTPYGNCFLCRQVVNGKPNPRYDGHRPEDCTCNVDTCHGHWAATTDPDIVRRWWTEEPEANIGAPCKLNGWAVIDIDPRNGGDRSYVAVEEHFGVLPGTAMQLTGGGGLHILYRTPGDVDLPGAPFPGIEIKHNGYILLSPSLHALGYRYRWPADGRFRHPDVAWPQVLLPKVGRGA